MKTGRSLIVIAILFFAEPLLLSATGMQMFYSSIVNGINGSATVAFSEKEILEQEIAQIEMEGKDIPPYECPNFKIGDEVVHSIKYLGYRISDFIGVVIKVESKPTTEYIHYIMVKRLSGSGTSGIYSEQFLYRVKIRK